MPRRSEYRCQSCGKIHSKWSGRCVQCGEWNSVEECVVQSKGQRLIDEEAKVDWQTPSDVISKGPEFLAVDNVELNRVLPGGIPRGGIILLGGEPGIGKSTLAAQICKQVVKQNIRVAIVSGEEPISQVGSRLQRLGVLEDQVLVAEMPSAEGVAASCLAGDVDLMILDSLQTLRCRSAEGSRFVGRGGFSTDSLDLVIEAARQSGTTLLLIGHVTKTGELAGPKQVEHMVDVVLQLEALGDQDELRILRPLKNRFGDTRDVGLFRMEEQGLVPVDQATSIFADCKRLPMPGQCLCPVMEGRRIFLVEVQALVSTSHLSIPLRRSNGFDANRLAMLLAVLEKRCGLYFSDLDVHVNVVGGLRLKEPAADLAVAAAVVSSFRDKALPAGWCVVGEVGLTGEVRHVNNLEQRFREMHRLGLGMMGPPGVVPASAGDKRSIFVTLENFVERFSVVR